MVLFTILLVALALVAAALLILTGLVGTSVFLLFGDVIAFALIIIVLIKLFRKKK